MDYAVRITRSYNDLRKCVEEIASKCGKVLVYEHEGSRVHCHFLLVECQVSTDTLKNYIKKELGVVDKKDWSFKKCSESYDDYVKYMSKGKYEFSYNKGFEEEYVKKHKARWEVKAAAQSAAAVKDKKQITKYEIVEMVIQRLPKNEGIGDREIIEEIFKVLKEKKQAIGMYKIMDIRDAVCMYGWEGVLMGEMLSVISRRKENRWQ